MVEFYFIFLLRTEVPNFKYYTEYVYTLLFTCLIKLFLCTYTAYTVYYLCNIVYTRRCIFYTQKKVTKVPVVRRTFDKEL